jgi:diaminopimelate dehydrogenase
MIKIGIVGYGNVGRGVELAIAQNDDMELFGIFTRRNPDSILPQTKGVKVYPYNDAEKYKNDIDVMVLCGGSATDLTEQGPHFAAMFNCVDSFDTHARIPEYFALVDEKAQKSRKIHIISTGWDPGLFSLMRALGFACIPQGEGYTFWGKGISQGHSDAIRRVAGVKFGAQYTIPNDGALAEVRKGTNPTLSTREKHSRECFVVAEDGANLSLIETTIKEMPNYFADYDTTVHFIGEEEFKTNHSAMPHGGFVLRTGATGAENAHRQQMEFSIKLDSNPEFTASIMIACARAAHRLHQKGEAGARTMFDLPLGLLAPVSPEELRKTML